MDKTWSTKGDIIPIEEMILMTRQAPERDSKIADTLSGADILSEGIRKRIAELKTQYAPGDVTEFGTPVPKAIATLERFLARFERPRWLN